jgi:hypothetical protein
LPGVSSSSRGENDRTAATAAPEGLVYRTEVLSVAEEEELLERFASLRFDPIVLHGRAARRTGRHFGLDYDYRAAGEGAPLLDHVPTLRRRDDP